MGWDTRYGTLGITQEALLACIASHNVPYGTYCDGDESALDTRHQRLAGVEMGLEWGSMDLGRL
jgi:hypothetical protein